MKRSSGKDVVFSNVNNSGLELSFKNVFKATIAYHIATTIMSVLGLGVFVGLISLGIYILGN